MWSVLLPFFLSSLFLPLSLSLSSFFLIVSLLLFSFRLATFFLSFYFIVWSMSYIHSFVVLCTIGRHFHGKFGSHNLAEKSQVGEGHAAKPTNYFATPKQILPSAVRAVLLRSRRMLQCAHMFVADSLECCFFLVLLACIASQP